jgi:N-methylhydantoinase B
MRENSCIGIPRHPASCSVATSNLADRLAGVVQSAVAEIRDGLGMAEGGSAFPGSCSVISGRNPNRGDEPFITQLFFAWTGGAARPHADGWLNHSGVVDGGALQRDSVELTEMRYPVVVKEQRLMPDSEGAGRTVGAPSARFEFAAVDAPVEAMYGADGCVHPPAGVRGGLAGGAGAQYRRLSSGEVVDESAFARVTLEPGESLISISAGGGGYGHPWLRDPAQVAADVQEGRISPERARAVYAVALEGDGTVEDNETRRLRSQAGSDPS